MGERPSFRPGTGFRSRSVADPAHREDLARSEALLSRVERVAHLGFWEWDRASGEVFWSPGAYRIFGRTPGDFTPSWDAFLAAIHPAHRPRMAEILEEVLRTGDPYSHAYRIVHSDGTDRWVQSEGEAVRDGAGRVTGMFGTVQDITAYQEVTARLAASERMFRQLAETLPATIAHLDAGLCYRFVNQGWERWIGLPADKVVGRKAWEVLDRALYERIQPHLAAALAGEEQRFEMTAALPGVGRRHICIQYVPDFGAEGTVAGVFVLGTDLTRQKRTEETLRRQKHKLAELDRRKDEFLAMLGHELRNPLAPIRYTAEALSRRPGDREEAARAAGVIANQADYLTALVDDLLDVTRIARGEIRLRTEPVDLRELVSRACAATRPMAHARGQVLVVSCPEGAVSVDGDPVRLLQVVENLLGNAVKYAGDGGRITAAVATEGGTATLRVADTGAGIAEDLLPRIFDRFSQGAGARECATEGLGLGLYLARALVERHGGTVRASSEGEGTGSEFVVHLPLTEATPMDATSAPHEPEPTPSCRILVVDDNAAVAESLSALLESVGHEVHTASDGASAMKAVERIEPAVVFIDIALPDLDGRELARQVRTHYPKGGVVLVALSGYGDVVGDPARHGADFDRCLTKPARPAELLDVMQAAMGESHDTAFDRRNG